MTAEASDSTALRIRRNLLHCRRTGYNFEVLLIRLHRFDGQPAQSEPGL
jgi:hypothetical protein